MKKKIKNNLNCVNCAILYLLMLVIGFNMHNFALSEGLSKIAFVDVNNVLSKSVQFMALKKERENNLDKLQKWILSAKADIDKQKTPEAKMKLAKKYDEELEKKKKAIQEDYTNKLNQIDKNISSTLIQEAKKQGYDIVLNKNAVLYARDDIDITAQIAKSVK